MSQKREFTVAVCVWIVDRKTILEEIARELDRFIGGSHTGAVTIEFKHPPGTPQ